MLSSSLSMAAPCRRRRAAQVGLLRDFSEPWAEAAHPKRSRHGSAIDLSTNSSSLQSLSALLPQESSIGLLSAPEWVVPPTFGDSTLGASTSSQNVEANEMISVPSVVAPQTSVEALVSGILPVRSSTALDVEEAAANLLFSSANLDSLSPNNDVSIRHRSWDEALLESLGDNDPSMAPPASKRSRTVLFASDVPHRSRVPGPRVTQHSLRNPYHPPSKRTCSGTRA